MALNPFQSLLLADTGISFGDEGKGRLIPELYRELCEQTGRTDPIRIVLKVNGGANSGHTVAGLKLNLIPAGLAVPEVPTLAIGSGVVADPRKLTWETRYAENHGLDVRHRMLVDERCMLADLTHRLLDLGWEHYRANVLGGTPRGSTGRGITPAYNDETGQCQIFWSAFQYDKDTFARDFHAKTDRATRMIQHVLRVPPEAWEQFFATLTQAETRANQGLIDDGTYPAEEFDFARFRGREPFSLHADALIDTYWETGRAWAERIGDVRMAILEALRDGDYVIGEFGQAYWLDKRFGFPPNLTASHTFTPEFFQSAGIPTQPVHNLGVCKAYDTKVGTHLFLTQIADGHPLGEKLKRIEYGTSTGRQRMVGWCDCVEKGDALRHGGFQDLVINKLDVLSYSGDWNGGELLICRAYRGPDGTIYQSVPRHDALRAQLQPVYIQLPGWAEDISGVRKWKDLPVHARRYIAVMVRTILDVATHDGLPLPPGFAPEDQSRAIEAANDLIDLPNLPNLRYVAVGPDPDQLIKDVPTTVELLREV